MKVNMRFSIVKQVVDYSVLGRSPVSYSCVREITGSIDLVYRDINMTHDFYADVFDVSLFEHQGDYLWCDFNADAPETTRAQFLIKRVLFSPMMDFVSAGVTEIHPKIMFLLEQVSVKTIPNG